MSEAKAEEKQAMAAPPLRGAVGTLHELWQLAEDYARERFPEWDSLPHCYCERGMDPAPTRTGKPRLCRKCKGWGRVGTNGKALRMPRNK